MNKTYLQLNNREWMPIARKLKETFSLPKINLNLAIYCKNENQSLEIGFINNKCYLRGRDKISSKSTPNMWLENKNIKFLLRIFNNLGTEKVQISEIVQLDYSDDKELIASLRIGTLLGDLLMINKNYKEKIIDILNIKESDLLESETLDNIITTKNIPTEPLFNKFNVPNPKIQTYTDRFAIDLLSGVTTLSHKISAKSNDYGIYENYYQNLLGHSIDCDRASQKNEELFKPLSIIIASYNSESTILKTLYSIQSQDLSQKNIAALDVIVVDDGWINPIMDIIKPHLKYFTFSLKVVRLEQNQGLSIARNMGYQLSRYENILFMDSDVMLAKNYLYEHSIRLQTIPNSLFVSFKENIEPDNKVASLDVIKKGLPVSTNLNDKRITRSVSSDVRWLNKTVSEGTEELLGETNLFKNFGYGRTINGCFDLPSMVVGHNMTMNKELVSSVGGFCTTFSGWGLEDAYFGARVIANGNFIIPILSTSVYHINHPPRAGSPEQQLIEHKQNTEIYNKLMRQQL